MRTKKRKQARAFEKRKKAAQRLRLSTLKERFDFLQNMIELRIC